MKDNYIVQAWLILALSICFGAALSGIELALAERIAQNKKDETYNQIPELVKSPPRDPNSPTAYEPFQADATKTQRWGTDGGHVAYKAFDSGGVHRGWVISASGQGFADKIEVLIGLDATGEKILGLYVLDQKETPALGDRIREADWRDQFAGKETSRDVVVSSATSKGSNGISAITGATVSSKSVLKIVNPAVKDFYNRLKKNELKSKE